jgi:hypothetical protein
MPEFVERRDEREAAKAQRLAPAVSAALARREPAREADPAYAIAPLDSGPPPARVGAGASDPTATAVDDGAAPNLGQRLRETGEQAFAAFVRNSDDRRLERTVGSDIGLRVLFGGMTQRFQPDKAQGFTGDIQYALRANGEVKP